MARVAVLIDCDIDLTGPSAPRPSDRLLLCPPCTPTTYRRPMDLLYRETPS